MNLPAFALRRRAFVMALFGLLILAGGSNYVTMSRRESPAITLRNAIVITRWEGAPVEQIEELVTDPLEKKIAELSEVMTITSDSRVGQSILNVELDEREMNIDQLWDEVRAKVSEVRLPDGCGVPFVDSDFGDTYDICLALFQRAPSGGWNEHNRIHRYSMRRLEVLAERIEDELKLVPQVARVDFWGVQQEVVYVEVDSADWAKIDLTAQELSDLMEARNIVAPGGEVTTPRGSFAVKPSGEFETVQEISDLVVGRIDGRIPVRLGDVPLRVYRGYEDPPKTKVRYADRRTRGVEGGIARLPTAPHIAGDSAIYLTAQLEAYRSGERRHEIMSLIARDLTDEDIADLAAWYSSIRITAELPE